MKYLLVIPFLICSALVLFATAIFLAWVFTGVDISDDLSTRAVIGLIAGAFGLFTVFMLWIEV